MSTETIVVHRLTDHGRIRAFVRSMAKLGVPYKAEVGYIGNRHPTWTATDTESGEVIGKIIDASGLNAVRDIIKAAFAAPAAAPAAKPATKKKVST